MAITLPDLPYGKGDLAPHISEQTLDFHYGKHHKAYVDKTNAAIEGTKLADASLEDIIRDAEGNNQGLFNNAAQVWNHSFYWNSMKPNGGGAPSGDIAAAIKDAFGGYDGFKETFAGAGAGQFGSGWAWLIARDGKLEVTKTLNAETPVTDKSATPILTMDVWEHAYYLDYQNKRPAYIDAFLDHLINWDFANANLSKA
ncbi:MAG: superoxide dismutase [Hyphococcus sp.]|nr:MAG: superoxide dismutase [Marinicaulis sp.]